jgi:hypothetical protein
MWSASFPLEIHCSALPARRSKNRTDEWAVGRRYFSTESMNKLYEPSQEEVVQTLLELQSV